MSTMRAGDRAAAATRQRLLRAQPRAGARVQRLPSRRERLAPSRLEPTTTVESAFAIIARKCLNALTRSRPAILRGEAEAVHGMRIALRQLRVTARIFETAIGAPITHCILDESRWLSGELAPARDFDVLLAAFEQTQDSAPANRERRALIRIRVRLYRRLAQCLQSARFERLLVQVRAAISAARRGAPPGFESPPLAHFAGAELRRRRAKFVRAARRLEERNAEERHRLRIRGRKLRFAMEFFRDVFPGKKNGHLHRDTVATLRRLQHALGQLNDLAQRGAVAGRFLRRVAPAEHAVISDALKTPRPAHRRRLERAAGRAIREFTEVEPFWN